MIVRKLKLKCEIYVIGIKILFFQLKYLFCNVELKVIEWQEWVYSQIFKED